MKNFLKRLVRFALKRLAKRRLKKFRGKVIGVTGSIGKTSTKDAIFTVLNSKFRVKKTQKSMNSDFGIVLTILDIESGFSSAFKWSWLLMKAFYNSFFRDESEVMVLEYGVDAPKDMDYLLSVVKPDIAVLTNVHPVHLAEGQFKDTQAIFEEKSKLVKALGKGGVAILNIDNPFTDALAGRDKEHKVVTYGTHEKADYLLRDVGVSLEGTKFVVQKGEDKFRVNLKVVGDYHAYAALPAIVCGELMGMNLEEITTALERYQLPPGRMSVIPAVNEATILDSSYNCSPEALRQALKLLKQLGVNRRKVAVIGNMNELGAASDEEHVEIGKVVAKFADVLMTVGASARLIADTAKEKGMKDVFDFRTSTEAVEFFKKKIQKGDLILVKGSQNQVRLEKFVKELMASPEDAPKLLVRQEKVWQAKL